MDVSEDVGTITALGAAQTSVIDDAVQNDIVGRFGRLDLTR